MCLDDVNVMNNNTEMFEDIVISIVNLLNFDYDIENFASDVNVREIVNDFYMYACNSYFLKSFCTKEGRWLSKGAFCGRIKITFYAMMFQGLFDNVLFYRVLKKMHGMMLCDCMEWQDKHLDVETSNISIVNLGNVLNDNRIPSSKNLRNQKN